VCVCVSLFYVLDTGSISVDDTVTSGYAALLAHAE
jgi:hypothetical protein